MLIGVLIKLVEGRNKVIRNVIQMVITTRRAGKCHINSRCKDLNAGVFLCNGIVERSESVCNVGVQPIIEVVFITDFDKIDGPRVRVSVFSSKGTILGINRSSQELNLVKGIFNVDSDVFRGDDILIEGETTPNGEN